VGNCKLRRLLTIHRTCAFKRFVEIRDCRILLADGDATVSTHLALLLKDRQPASIDSSNPVAQSHRVSRDNGNSRREVAIGEGRLSEPIGQG
jgi:hypothetical protein